tara:strand:- start:85 stop:981 length:897 start_codon:yes stop_codon:yes gene_type:complete
MNQGVSYDKTPFHIPVLKNEIISFLDIRPDGIYVDGTCGLGGHSKIILKNLSSSGTLISIDLDEEALSICKNSLESNFENFHLKKNSYSNLPSILKEMGINKVSGIILDLGLSSFQLDSNHRGFSYKNDCHLDMRFDQSNKITAAKLINNSTQNELADIIFYNSEERRSRAIAKKLAQSLPINNVQDLVRAIKNSTPPHKRNRTIARVFQAFRIALNNELGRLSEFLSSYIHHLEKGGKIVIISFHSLEDRLVKKNFKDLSKNGLLKILTRKPIMASDEEVNANRRSKSAKMRCAVKT